MILSPQLRRMRRRASLSALARFTAHAQRAVGVHGEVTVQLASRAEVQRLNRRFRGKDRPTDVLSFPAEESDGGDIAVCMPLAAAHARVYGHSAADEVKVLILHGLLHLAGYDHESDGGRMARREERLRRSLGLTSGLIARSAAHARGKRRPPR